MDQGKWLKLGQKKFYSIRPAPNLGTVEIEIKPIKVFIEIRRRKISHLLLHLESQISSIQWKAKLGHVL